LSASIVAIRVEYEFARGLEVISRMAAIVILSLV
jgi:hypothetical protein